MWSERPNFSFTAVRTEISLLKFAVMAMHTRKFFAGLVVAISLAASILTTSATAGQASAAPQSCRATTYANITDSICTGGSGWYRSAAKCLNIYGYYYSYGPWVTIGRHSTTDCGFGMLRQYWTAT